MRGKNVWTARSIPQGTDEVIDVASLIFSLPIFLTPPAKVKRQVLIHSILNNVYGDYKFIDEVTINVNNEAISSRQWITFKDRHIRVTENSIQLLTSTNGTTDNESVVPSLLRWNEHFQNYGGIKNGITEVRLKLGDITNPDEIILS